MRRKDLDEVLFDAMDRVSVPSIYRLHGPWSSITQKRRVERTYHVSDAVDGGESQVNCTRSRKLSLS